jgi:DNA-directed RNA polymerase specialized sigma24 family protein
VHVDYARRARRSVPFDAAMLVEAPAEIPAQDDVREVLARLPDATSQLLRFVYEDGFTHAEVAAMTNSTAGAVRSAVWRARHEFQTAWEQQTMPEEKS